MKRVAGNVWVILIALSLLFVTGCGNDSTSGSSWPEYETISEHKDTENLSYEEVDEGPNTHVLIWEDTDGKKQYKTIYVEETQRLKIIDLDGGELYNESID